MDLRIMNSQFLSPLIVSLQVAIIGGAIAIIAGTVIAYLMNKYQFRGKTALEILFLMPIVLPPSVIGFLLLVTIGASSPLYPLIELLFGQTIIFTKTAAIIAASIVAFPIMYQSAKIAFNHIDPEIIDAAKLDQATEVEIIKYITVPMAIFGLATGAVLALARAFGEFGATLMVAGNIPGKTETLPIAIYMAMAANERQMAAIYVAMMIVTSVIFLLIVKKLSKYS
ncbi:molybdate ABC transporter permease subunit [Mollicutes bacterium LVI A0039]|nr:molybdate ABC transporter permease subunit [Mollicutes bacterium LVI A0039]